MCNEFMKILILEDEKVLAESIRKSFELSKKDYNIEIVSTLKKYYESISKNIPGIVIADMSLPNGRIIDILTYPPEKAEFPILLMTSDRDEHIAVEAVKAGALDYIIKSEESFLAMPHTVIHAIHEWNMLIERKNGEMALKESEERYKKLVASITDYIYTVKIKNGTPYSTQYGPGCITVTGYSSREFEKDPYLWYKIISNEDKELVIKLSSKQINGEEIKPFEHRIIHKNGSIKWVRNSQLIRINSKGEIEGYDGLIEDITERKLAEENLKKSNEELERRVEKRTQELQSINKELVSFSYSVSHDLKAPLRAINGFSNLLIEKYIDKLDKDAQKYLNNIIVSTQKMDKLITDLLDLSKITMLEINFSKIDMNSLVNSIYHEIASSEVKKSFIFDVKSLPEVLADSRLIRQVWINLLSNAIKYSMKSKIKKVKVEGYKEGDNNIYFVKDTGAGFNPEYAHKLFGVFQRLHTSEEFEGTGVGLAIVQRIIHRHKGRVWAEGKINNGATFYFSLPNKEIDNE